jgi:AAA+ superfamily predicted ATPase
MNDAAIAAVRAAVAADPGNAELRLALAELLASAGRGPEAITEAATVLTTAPGNARALAILTGAARTVAEAPAADNPPPVAPTGTPAGDAGTRPAEEAGEAPRPSERRRAQDPAQPAWASPPEPTPGAGTRPAAPAAPEPSDGVAPGWPENPPAPLAAPAPGEAMGAAPPNGGSAQPSAEFDWGQAEGAFSGELPPPFIEHTNGDGGEDEGVAPIEPQLARVSFADVGGLDNVKARLNESFIQPMRNAAIARAFKKSLRGGLLLYGPPGCGKTFMARAVAGELEADFMAVVLTDVVDGVHGRTEKNIHAVFQEARVSARKKPTVLFLDEIDALALKRSTMSGSSSWLRSTVNQLLLEMDSMSGNNDGLYILAATNHPWDLDEAVLRPGRLDRSVLVSPPDAPARGAILRRQLESRPVAGIHLDTLVGGTEGFSGADLEHLVTTASEKAMMTSIAAGEVLPIGMNHLAEAMAEVRPSTAEWLASARNVVRFAADGGRYDDLRDYLNASGAGTENKRDRRKGWWS